MNYEERLKNFADGVLGDHVPLEAITIRKNPLSDGLCVCVDYGCALVPQRFLFDDWKNESKGTEFENAKLFMEV